MKLTLKYIIMISLSGFSFSALAQSNPSNFSRTTLSINKKMARSISVEAIKNSLSTFAGSDFQLIQQHQGLTGKHLQFQEKIGGLPVYSSYTTVHINSDSSIDDVEVNQARVKKSLSFNSNSFIQTDKTAVQLAVSAVGSKPTSEPTLEKNIYMDNGEARKAWKVEFLTEKPSRSWRVLVDDQTGKPLEKRNLNFHADGKGWVFNPNPVVTSGIMDLKDTLNQDSAALTAERQQVILKNLDGSGTLNGKYVKIKSAKARNANLIFDFTRSQIEFEETMVYYHLDTMQAYIQSLGFNQINNRVIAVNVNTITDDNSFYSPMTKEITFGTGGVDDAEDADIIYHEAGHSMQDNQVPNFGNSSEGRAMGEGFGDYWAASAFEGVGPLKDLKSTFVGTWDAVEYNPATANAPAFLRRLDSKKHYPQDLTGEEHDDGEIWSAVLWEIRQVLGKTATDKLVLESHFYLNANSGFVEGANALIKADAKLFAGQNAKVIKALFKTRGILK